jgi:HAD superfamily hydrolase (TIGR01484 family)
MPGIIALDIDGTLTAQTYHLPTNVADYLGGLLNKGWQIVFITGRPFKWGQATLAGLNFPHYLAVQNGAIILEMPSATVLARKYLDRSIFPAMDTVCKEEGTDFIIYAGFEYDDICYYRPKRFAPALLNYLEKRTKTLSENWVAVESYDAIELTSFPSIKCFGLCDKAVILADKIEKQVGLHVPLIRDPFDEQYYVAQATHADISKGHALTDLIALKNIQGNIIAAGDDLNDLSMLQVADCKIVMATAPEEMLRIADVGAPPAAEEGIISGLEQAIARIEKGKQ